MTVVDSYKAYKHHLPNRNPEKNLPVRAFANLLAQELLQNDEHDLSPDDISNLPFLGSLPVGDSEPFSSDRPQDPLPGNGGSFHLDRLPREIEMTELGSVSGVSSDIGQNKHTMKMYPPKLTKDGVRRTVRNRCRLCYKKGKECLSRYYCQECDACFCADGSGTDGSRKCWSDHVKIRMGVNTVP